MCTSRKNMQPNMMKNLVNDSINEQKKNVDSVVKCFYLAVNQFLTAIVTEDHTIFSPFKNFSTQAPVFNAEPLMRLYLGSLNYLVLKPCELGNNLFNMDQAFHCR